MLHRSPARAGLRTLTFTLPLEWAGRASVVGNFNDWTPGRLTLSADGDVTRVAPFHATPECAQGADPAMRDYEQAVGDALQRWEFTPAMVCEFPPELLAMRDKGDCRGSEITVRRVPVRLNYAFTFSSRDGRRRVGVARQRASGGVE